MVYTLFKIVDKKVEQITLCTKSKAIHSELIPGLFFTKLNATGNLFKIEAEIIIEHFSAFDDILFEIQQATFYTIKSTGNLDLIISDRKNYRTSLVENLAKQKNQLLAQNTL